MFIFSFIKQKLVGTLERSLKRVEKKLDADSDQVAQLVLSNQYKLIVAAGKALPRFDEVGFRRFSQNSEDGILLYLFALIGTTNKRCVELCASDGIQCNTANLVINHGWHALMVDGNEQLINKGRQYYSRHPDTFILPPVLKQAWITRENVNSVVSDSGFRGEIDLLSLDLDGVDYWIWEALEVIYPRVVVAEIQCIWPPEYAVTVPYDPSFRATYHNGFGVYSGASLTAFVKLAHRKGYRLVGIERNGFNAFFMRNDTGLNYFPEMKAAECLNTLFALWAQDTLLPHVKDFNWQQV